MGEYKGGTGFTIINSTPKEFVWDPNLEVAYRPRVIEEKLYVFWQDPRIVNILGAERAAIEIKQFHIDYKNSPYGWFIISKNELKYDPQTGVTEIN
jgi:hypothetical protein